jgi:hypothetical protein
LDINELSSVVKAGAKAALDRTGVADGGDDTIWAAATLRELAVARGDVDEAECQYERLPEFPRHTGCRRCACGTNSRPGTAREVRRTSPRQ